jgi:hypothetical protein
MSLLGIHLTLLIGPNKPAPAPATLAEALQSVEVTQSDEKRSGFQISFAVGRSMPWELLEYTALSSPLLRPFSRVILLVRFGIAPRILMDGFITNIQLAPRNVPGTSLLTVTGEDVSVMMDLKEEVREHPVQDEETIATEIIESYRSQLGVVPKVVRPKFPDLPLATERTEVQTKTDLEYLTDMAHRHGYTFFVTPGREPMDNQAYWGPPRRIPVKQPALSVNMGSATNVETIDFAYNALAPTLVSGELLGQAPFFVRPHSPAPLALRPAMSFQSEHIRETVFSSDIKGLTREQAKSQAQAMADKSMDQTVTASGEVDAAHYGDLITARSVIGLRGAGLSFDGLYYVKSVTHSIKRGSYRMKFALAREGLGTTTPFVMP